jgi:hypothetical protein
MRTAALIVAVLAVAMPAAGSDEMRLERLFRDPTKEFRLLQIIHGFDHMGQDRDSIGARLDRLIEVGCGGIVTNVGWKNYLRDEAQWRIFGVGIEEAKKRGLRIWLYDEDGYPSGAAGDLVLEGHPELQSMGLVCVSAEARDGESVSIALPEGAGRWVHATALPVRDGKPRLQGAKPIAVPGGERIEWRARTGDFLVCAFAQQLMFKDTHPDANVYKSRPYVNLLVRQATERFIGLTHREYARRLPKGTSVEAVFTDEPSLTVAYHRPDQTGKRLAALPWEPGLPEAFRKARGRDLLPMLPALFFDFGIESRKARCEFWDFIADRVAQAFFMPIRNWCRRNRTKASGHILCEERLYWHVWFEGDLYRQMRHFDLPGIDILSSKPENLMAGDGFLTPKFVSSAAHHYGRKNVMSETSDYIERTRGGSATLEEMMGTAGLQYALGVNIITSYYPWSAYSRDSDVAWQRGEKPAQVSYRAYNDYVGRLGVMLDRGKHVCDVALFYPITTIQAHFAPTNAPMWELKAQHPVIQHVEQSFRDLARALLQNQADFDIVDDQALQRAEIKRGVLAVANERYRALVLPPMLVIKEQTLQRILEFQRSGGHVIALEQLSSEAAERGKDADLKRAATTLKRAGGVIAPDIAQLIAAIRQCVQPDVLLDPATPSVLVNHRREQRRDIYFLTNTSASPVRFSATLRAQGRASFWRPLTGSVEPAGESGGSINISLGPCEAVFIVIET